MSLASLWFCFVKKKMKPYCSLRTAFLPPAESGRLVFVDCRAIVSFQTRSGRN